MCQEAGLKELWKTAQGHSKPASELICISVFLRPEGLIDTITLLLLEGQVSQRHRYLIYTNTIPELFRAHLHCLLLQLLAALSNNS